MTEIAARVVLIAQTRYAFNASCATRDECTMLVRAGSNVAAFFSLTRVADHANCTRRPDVDWGAVVDDAPGTGARSSTSRSYWSLQGWHVFNECDEVGRVFWSQGCEDVVCGRRDSCKGHHAGTGCEDGGTDSRCHTNAEGNSTGGRNAGAGDACSFGAASTCRGPACDSNAVARRDVTGSGWRRRPGVGEHELEGVSLPGLALLRQDEARQLHDGGCSKVSR